MPIRSESRRPHRKPSSVPAGPFVDPGTGRVYFTMPDGTRNYTGENAFKPKLTPKPAPKPAPAQPAQKKRNAVVKFLAWTEKNRADYYEDHPEESRFGEDLRHIGHRVANEYGTFGNETNRKLQSKYGQDDEWINEFQYGKRRKPERVKVIIREIPAKPAPRKRKPAQQKVRIIYVPVPDRRRG